MKTKCKYCGYQWESRVRKPKACPSCKRYFPLIDMQDEIKQRGKESELHKTE